MFVIIFRFLPISFHFSPKTFIEMNILMLYFLKEMLYKMKMENVIHFSVGNWIEIYFIKRKFKSTETIFLVFHFYILSSIMFQSKSYPITHPPIYIYAVINRKCNWLVYETCKVEKIHVKILIEIVLVLYHRLRMNNIIKGLYLVHISGKVNNNLGLWGAFENFWG